MKYTYDTFTRGGAELLRRDTSNSPPSVETLPEEGDWRVDVTNNIDGSVFELKSRDALEDWIVARERDIWSTGHRPPKAAPVDSNLKTAAAVGKPMVSGVPPNAFLAVGAAMQDGVEKYGAFNWRDTTVTASVFYNAMMRHLLAWYSGEDCTSDGKHLPHLAHIMANCAILLDAKEMQVFTDDRPK